MLNLLFLDTDRYSFPPDIRSQITKTLVDAENDVRLLLPGLSKTINVTVYPTGNVIPETGETGRTVAADWIQVSLDPNHAIPMNKIISSKVRSTFFHEANHASRYSSFDYYSATLIDHAVMEGLATVFERDYAGSKPLWSIYDPKIIHDWFVELVSVVDRAQDSKYFFDHPDGRRWIVYKVGTYIVDQAIAKSRRSCIDLSVLSAGEVLSLAKLS